MPVSSLGGWVRSYAADVIVDLSGRGDVTTLADAIDRINALGGGSIMLGRGTFQFSANKTITVRCKVFGQGDDTVLNQTGAASLAINSVDCEVSDMRMNGMRINVQSGAHRFKARNLHGVSTYSDAGIKIDTANNSVVDSCIFESVGGPAILLVGTVNYTLIKNNQILSGNPAASLIAGQAGSSGTGNWVLSNTILTGTYQAIEFNGNWSQTWINSNYIHITGDDSSGISLVANGSSDSMICDNHIELNTPAWGIECGADRTLIQGNVFKGVMGSGVGLNNGGQVKDVIIVDNIFTCTNTTGIAICMAAGTGRNIHIRGNHIINCFQTAINCAGLTFCDVSHNIIRYESATYGTTAVVGINLHNMTDSTVKANNIHNNTNINSTTMTTGQAGFTRNTIEGNHEDGGGVVGYGMGSSAINSNNVLANHMAVNFVTRSLSFNASCTDWTFTNIHATQLCDMPTIYIESGANPTAHNAIPPTYISIASPEGSITAPVGSLCKRRGGGAATTLYVKESGSGNTGWVAK